MWEKMSHFFYTAVASSKMMRRRILDDETWSIIPHMGEEILLCEPYV